MIEQHNLNHSKTYSMTVNQFADLTQEEFKASYLGLSVPHRKRRQLIVVDHQGPGANYEQEVDWLAAGMVTPVKNQLMCASCWAFCSIGALESAYLISTGRKQLFSEQQLVDCSTPYGNKGCHGGDLDPTFRFLAERGTTTQDIYPYVGKDQNCKHKGEFKIKTYGYEVTC
jgi:C1A family cysteine protease